MKKMIENGNINSQSNMNYIIKGIVISILFTLTSLLLFALVLTYTDLGESTISPVIIIVSALSILIGSSISTIKIKKHGLLNGAIIGGVYIVLLYGISSIVNTGFEVNTDTIVMMVSSVLAGIIGGVVGVNIK